MNSVVSAASSADAAASPEPMQQVLPRRDQIRARLERVVERRLIGALDAAVAIGRVGRVLTTSSTARRSSTRSGPVPRAADDLVEAQRDQQILPARQRRANRRARRASARSRRGAGRRPRVPSRRAPGTRAHDAPDEALRKATAAHQRAALGTAPVSFASRLIRVGPSSGGGVPRPTRAPSRSAAERKHPGAGHEWLAKPEAVRHRRQQLEPALACRPQPFEAQLAERAVEHGAPSGRRHRRRRRRSRPHGARRPCRSDRDDSLPCGLAGSAPATIVSAAGATLTAERRRRALVGADQQPHGRRRLPGSPARPGSASRCPSM